MLGGFDHGSVAGGRSHDPHPLLLNNVMDFVHHDYSDEPEFSNINPIRIDGTLNVTHFIVRSVTTQSNTLLQPGTHGRIGHESADFEQDFIVGDGLLIVVGDSL